MNYPIVLYPKLIQEFCRQHPLPNLPTDSNEQVQPLTPPKFSPNLPVTPTFPKKFAAKLTKLLLAIWLFWLIGVVIGVLLGLTLDLPPLATLSLIGAYCCLLAALYLRVKTSYTKMQSRYKTQLAQYRQQLSEYQAALVLLKPETPTNSEALQFLKEGYQQQIKQRMTGLLRLLQGKAKPMGVSEARQGVSEEQFFHHLQYYFDNAVQGAEFKTPWQGRNYSADYLIIHPPSGLGINCECDEPYALLSNQPTHCIDQDSDRRRNQFFLDHNWIVVRFTERQVVQAPKSCCKAIAQVIAVVTGDRSYLQQLESVSDLLPQKPWTKADARRMAKKNYRLSYLPDSVKPSPPRRSGRRKSRRSW
ncbi:MAG: hypothetical protein F6K36_25990 [Symploca sp. SIO3C6]|uniref:DUF559 domain-containing protein n=1 Tax=Symploca sp. SIO1C4 TaxID=2607765 RepID=A0A6B3NC20_9CYAN|nr:hypothetical protein [Symploca sp. SIO3C6]NER30649.1 hypothetical protein [Symploca sp. SIO1C4]